MIHACIVYLQVHIEVLRLLLSVAKEVGPDSLAASLGHMLTATAASRARATTQKKKFASITAQYGHAGHDHGVPGYISLGGAASEWSDGFRTVRSLKYGGSSDGFSELYRKIVVVGGLSDKQEKWPEALTRYMKVCVGAYSMRLPFPLPLICCHTPCGGSQHGFMACTAISFVSIQTSCFPLKSIKPACRSAMLLPC